MKKKIYNCRFSFLPCIVRLTRQISSKPIDESENYDFRNLALYTQFFQVEGKAHTDIFNIDFSYYYL